MPFGVVSGVGRGMGVLDRGGDRRRETGSFGVNVGQHPIVTDGWRRGSSQITLGFAAIVRVRAFSVHWS